MMYIFDIFESLTFETLYSMYVWSLLSMDIPLSSVMRLLNTFPFFTKVLFIRSGPMGSLNSFQDFAKNYFRDTDEVSWLKQACIAQKISDS